MPDNNERMPDTMIVKDVGTYSSELVVLGIVNELSTVQKALGQALAMIPQDQWGNFDQILTESVEFTGAILGEKALTELEVDGEGKGEE